jgi:glutamate-1-semialdehyde 2,1-aminomutase
MPALGAFVEATRINAEEDVPRGLWAYGRRLKAGIAEAAAANGLQDHVFTEGPEIMMHYVTRGADGQPSMPMRTLLAQEMIRRGVMMPWLSTSQAHGETELQMTFEALDGALKIYAAALNEGVDRYKDDHVLKPVFRTHN